MKRKWIEIASADDDVVGGELAEWAGLSELWGRYDLSRWFGFLRDVADPCEHIFIQKLAWGGDLPGHSGTWHVVETDDRRKLKTEMRNRLAQLLWNNRRPIVERSKQEKRALA